MTRTLGGCAMVHLGRSRPAPLGHSGSPGRPRRWHDPLVTHCTQAPAAGSQCAYAQPANARADGTIITGIAA
jgi:hypothetical protein